MSSKAIAERLRERQPEIAQQLLLAIPAGSRDPLSGQDAEYAVGQREAITAALDCALGALAHDPGRESSAPAIVAQARRSARHAVSLETVIGLYVAGRELLGDLVAGEAEHHSAEEARQAQTVLGELLQRLVPVVARAHRTETERLHRSPQQRRAGLLRKLLNGEHVDATRVGYDFSGWHTGLIATGPSADTAASRLAKGLGQMDALSIEHDDIAAWGWLSGPRPLPAKEIEQYVLASGLPGVALTLGDPGSGVAGWRMTHRQAQEAHRVALLVPQPVTTYSDVGLLAPWAADRAAAAAFVQTHLGPLAELKGGGTEARAVLREVFKARLQIAPAASALKVHRGTLRDRLSRIERHLGFPVASRQAELEVALRLEALHGLPPGT